MMSKILVLIIVSLKTLSDMTSKKIIYFTNTDWHFFNHLLPIAQEALRQGYKVKIVANFDKYQEKIEKEGIDTIPLTLNRNSINPFRELICLLKLISIIKREKPDILHNFTIKPILYGTIVGFFCHIPLILNNFLGMGYLFINNKFSTKIIRQIYCKILFVVGKYKKLKYVVQNFDDYKLLAKLKISKKEDIVVQCSVGVDTKVLKPLPIPKGKIVFALVARMLEDKGVYEFIEAAKILHYQNVNAEFWLVGSPDKENSSSIPESILKKYDELGYIKYLGFRNDIKEIWKASHVAVLPSYREGLSRSLLEAGAYGRAIITTDAPGGRELIEDNVNGILVPIKDHLKLEAAMNRLIKDIELYKKLSNEIRVVIENKYDLHYIARAMVSLY